MKINGVFGVTLIASFTFASADTPDTAVAFSIETYKPARFMIQSLLLSPSLDFTVEASDDSTDYSLRERSNTSGYLGGNGSYWFRNHTIMSDLEMSTIVSVSGNGWRSIDRQFQPSLESQDRVSYHPGWYYGIVQHARYRRYVKGRFFVEGEINPDFRQNPYTRISSRNSTFSGVGFDSNNAPTSRYTVINSSSDSRSVIVSVNASGSVGSGWIAPVTSAAVVLHMINRIALVTGKRPEVSEAQKRNWANLLDRLQRRRVFDSRLAVIETMDSIASHLRSETIIDKETARLTMELHDIWAYGYRQERYSGKEIKCSPLAYASSSDIHSSSRRYGLDSIGPFDPGFSGINPKDLPENAVDSSRYYKGRVMFTYGGCLYAGYSKPYGCFFEIDGSVEGKGTMNTLIDTVSSYSEGHRFRGTYPNAMGKLSAALRWFPSMRSTISLRNYLQVSKDYSYRYRSISGDGIFEIPDPSETSTYIEAYSGLNSEYFLSPRCSYNVYGSMTFQRGSRRYGSSFYAVPVIRNLYFSCGGYLSYALF
jgi:hypothetical protein